MFEWSRGYTPVGVEVWNAMRAVDYLETRPEVDGRRIGMTGISGGGSVTWFTAAADERIAAAGPVCSTYNRFSGRALDGRGTVRLHLHSQYVPGRLPSGGRAHRSPSLDHLQRPRGW